MNHDTVINPAHTSTVSQPGALSAMGVPRFAVVGLALIVDVFCEERAVRRQALLVGEVPMPHAVPADADTRCGCGEQRDHRCERSFFHFASTSSRLGPVDLSSMSIHLEAS